VRQRARSPSVECTQHGPNPVLGPESLSFRRSPPSQRKNCLTFSIWSHGFSIRSDGSRAKNRFLYLE